MAEQGLFVSDIFASIQGEGGKIGTPSIFLRLGICNLQCTWCDTPYTWKKGVADYQSRSFEWISKKIEMLRKNGRFNNLVITGGEPLLQQQSLVHFLNLPVFKDMKIECETNGSMPLLPEMKKILKRVHFTISPKLEDSGNKTYTVHIYPNAVLKFVYVNKKSELLIDRFLALYKNRPHDMPIYIMPEGVSVRAMEKKYKNILKYCLRRGFIFTPRLHIYLFGNKRGT